MAVSWIARNSRAVAVLTASLLLMGPAACAWNSGSAGVGSTTTQETVATGIPTTVADENAVLEDVGLATATRSPEPTDAYMASRIDGTLILDDGGCVQIAPAEEIVPVVWPWGYTARRVGTQVEVLSPDGAVVGRTGSAFSRGGGFSPTAGLGDQRCLRPDVDAFWLSPPGF